MSESNDNLVQALASDTVEILGRTVTVKANFALFARYKKVTGKGLLLKAGLGEDADASEVAALVWVVLGCEASGLSLDDVLEKLTRDDLPAIVQIVQLVFAQSQLTESQKNAPAALEA